MPRRTPRPARPSIAVILLIIAGLVEGVIVSSFVRVPGYVDAEYYFDGGINLAGGKGWKEPYLWNYLDNPDRLPHPAFSYWMPLSALISAAGIWINGSADFQSARWLFTGLAALLPVLTYQLGRSLHGDNRLAIWGGVFALAPGFLSAISLYNRYVYTGALVGVFVLFTGFIRTCWYTGVDWQGTVVGCIGRPVSPEPGRWNSLAGRSMACMRFPIEEKSKFVFRFCRSGDLAGQWICRRGLPGCHEPLVDP